MLAEDFNISRQKTTYLMFGTIPALYAAIQPNGIISPQLLGCKSLTFPSRPQINVHKLSPDCLPQLVVAAFRPPSQNLRD
jgi:hypothetical protein